jgi:hypothetical protein
MTRDRADVAYTYDALGRRIEVIDHGAATATRYYYDGWRVRTEGSQKTGVRRGFGIARAGHFANCVTLWAVLGLSWGSLGL